jgi:hypothetical protein
MSDINKNCVNFSNNTKFPIRQLTRLREDKCYKNVRNESSTGPGNYKTDNYNDCTCEALYTKELSLQQPGLFYRDGYGWTSNNGCNIDNDSKIRNSDNLTNKRAIHQLFERPYATIPYMGRGEGDVCTESKLRSAEDTSQNRPCNNLAGVFIDRYTPQLPCIRANIQNPRNIIPEDTDKTWVRGGQPSRQIIRNKNYLKKCGFEYNGKLWQRK